MRPPLVSVALLGLSVSASAGFIASCGEREHARADAMTDAAPKADGSTEPKDAGTAGPCDPETGLARPLPACSRDFPCTRVAPELPQEPIISTSDPIACADDRWTERREWAIDGVARQACFFRPEGAAPDARRPLVIFFHPGGSGGDVAEQETHLLDKAAASGFLLAVPQGRNLHFPTTAPRDGRHHDFYFRDLLSPSSNPDIASADRLIDDLVAEGAVDPQRIYVMGWSNGAFFGQLYAIARHETATPGGSRVAAAAVFSAGDPFDEIERDPFSGKLWKGPESCQLKTLPSSTVPILLVYRTCDLAVPCGASDLGCFGSEPGFVTSDWLTRAREHGVTGLEGHLIGGLELGADIDTDRESCTTITSCDPSPCTSGPTSIGCQCLLNHLRWPDGAYDVGKGSDREPLMLDFLERHPFAW